MRAWAHDRWTFPVPAHHSYPVSKHRLLRDRLLADGICSPEELHEAPPAPWSSLTRVHDPALLGRIRRGQLSVREQRGLGSRGRWNWSSGPGEFATVRCWRRARRCGPGLRSTSGVARTMRVGTLPGATACSMTSRSRSAPYATRAWRSEWWWSTATCTRATVRRTCSAPTRSRSRCRCTGPAITRSAGPVGPGPRPRHRHGRRRIPRRARRRAGHCALRRGL